MIADNFAKIADIFNQGLISLEDIVFLQERNRFFLLAVSFRHR